MLSFVKADLDLEKTLKPSFVLAFLERVGPLEWRKIVGKYKGCVIGQRDSLIYSNTNEKALLYWSGAWFNPRKVFASLKAKLTTRERELVKTLIDAYSNVSLSVNPYDLDLMIVPILLSRRTDYERNVLRWCRELWNRANSFEELLELDLKVIGTSYQLVQLKMSLIDFKSEVIPKLNGGLTSSELRLALMKCRYVGPKVADAYLLFTGLDISATPIDVHLINMIRRLSLIDHYKLPSKEYCRKFVCEECPIFDVCLRATFTKKFKKLAGWLQTVFYLHDKLYCRRLMCSECELRYYCINREKLSLHFSKH